MSTFTNVSGRAISAYLLAHWKDIALGGMIYWKFPLMRPLVNDIALAVARGQWATARGVGSAVFQRLLIPAATSSVGVGVGIFVGAALVAAVGSGVVTYAYTKTGLIGPEAETAESWLPAKHTGGEKVKHNPFMFGLGGVV